ncbi:TetR/AcrR family transcriptional regulator [Thiobacillus denitrificans]|uniref:HTH tetR-type domain-containing protein n=1 Tax=Thiobacillus denitrificans TaxID=36861 RepID=A0A106BLJ3_THIDE|nr:TetR/AcrR family transcriptional regulator [Thiobacillus denitrificans]KVW94688.1 hypothetical protein ABW22_11650 [Thiobacillus denitrificans]
MKKTDPESILDNALSLFRAKGYKSMSMADIGKASGLLKGSIYHHFPSKEAILISSIDRLSDHFEKAVFSLAHSESMSEKQRLEAMVSAIEGYFIENKACVMAHLSMEAMQDTTQAKSQIQSFFRRWRRAFESVLVSRHGAPVARRLAEDAVSQLEGAILWLNIFGDPAPLRWMCGSIKELL